MVDAEGMLPPVNHRSRNSTSSTPSTLDRQDENTSSPPCEALERSSSWGMATQMVHALFGIEFGPCWGDFFCSHGRIRGRLYAVTDGILFYSNLLGFERRLCLQFANVTSIALHRTTSIRIEIADFESYIFRSFHEREQVLQLLVRLKRLVDKKRARLEMNRGATAPSHNPAEGMETDYFDQWEKRQNQYENQWRNDEMLLESPLPSGLRSSFSSANVNRSIVAGRSPSPIPNRRRAVSDSFVRSSHIPVSKTTGRPELRTSSHNPFLEVTSDTLLELWNATARKLLALEEVGIEPIRLQCSIDAFYNLFLQNEATTSFEHYQKDFIRDRDVRMTHWINDSPSDNQSDQISVYFRTLTFTHPIKSTMGMGPSEAKTTRKQLLRRYQQYGMTLENITAVEGIPAADTFSVHDFWRIEADGTDTVTISANFAPRFTKRTIFKNLIEKSVLKETKAWFAGYRALITETLEKTKSSTQMAPTSVPIDKPTGMESSEIYPRTFLWSLYWSVLLMTLLMVVLVVHVIRINGLLSDLRAEMVVIRSSNSHLALHSECGYQRHE